MQGLALSAGTDNAEEDPEGAARAQDRHANLQMGFVLRKEQVIKASRSSREAGQVEGSSSLAKKLKFHIDKPRSQEPRQISSCGGVNRPVNSLIQVSDKIVKSTTAI